MPFTRFPNLKNAAVAAMAAAAIAAAPASASVAVTDPGNRQVRNTGGGYSRGTRGYDILVGSADATVTHLGVWDGPGNQDNPGGGEAGDGLEQSAVVGIYHAKDRKLIAQATVPAGDQGELEGEFRYVSLAEPVTLTAGQMYRIVAGVSKGGNAFRNYHGGSQDPTFSEHFAVGDTSYHNTSGAHDKLAFPNGRRNGAAYMGPNFRYTGGGPVPPPAPLVPTEAPGARLKDLESLPGEAVYSEDFESVEGNAPQGWTMVPETGQGAGDSVSIDAPGAGNAGHAMKIGRNLDIRQLDPFGGLTYTLPEPADRVAIEFDIKAEVGDERYPVLELFTLGPDSIEPTQVRLRVYADRIEQNGGIRNGWSSIALPKDESDFRVHPAWYRVRVVADRDSEGIDLYVSEPDRPELPASPTATLPAYGVGRPITAVRFGVSNIPGSNHSWIDNVAIRTGTEIPAPGKPGEVFTLWTGDAFPRTFADIDYPQGIEYHIICPQFDGWNWFHGAAIGAHEGKLYATWGANKGHENSNTEVILFATSSDGGKTWSEPEVLADGDGKFANSHGTLLSHNGTLWSFNPRWLGGWNNPLSTEAFTLNEETGEWESRGVVATQGWPLDRPEKTADGNWVMGVSGFKMRRPGVMISHGDDLTKWDTIAIPTIGTGMFAETSVIVDGNHLVSINRWGGRSPLVSTSHDGGRTWKTAKHGNLPMAGSKPDAGVLSTGQWYAVVNMGSRDNLMIAVGKPGEKGLSQVYKVRYGSPPIGKSYDGPSFPGAYAYPYSMEHDGKLYVVYSVAKNDIELAVIPIESLKAE